MPGGPARIKPIPRYENQTTILQRAGWFTLVGFLTVMSFLLGSLMMYIAGWFVLPIVIAVKYWSDYWGLICVVAWAIIFSLDDIGIDLQTFRDTFVVGRVRLSA